MLTATLSTTDATPLTIQQCDHCTTLVAPLMTACPSCGATTLTPVQSHGVGSVISSKKLFREPANTYGTEPLSTIAIVALDEGPLVYSWLIGDADSQSDTRVRVLHVPDASDDDGLPIFTVTSTATAVAA